MSSGNDAEKGGASDLEVQELRAEVGRLEAELAILAEVSGRFHGPNDLNAVLDTALEEILARLGLEMAWILLGDEGGTTLELAAARGISHDYLQSIRTGGVGECLCRDVFRSGAPMQARNTTDCPRMPTIARGGPAVAHACIPLRFRGERRGVLNVAARPGELFTDRELRFLEMLGHQVAIALERATRLKSTQAHIVRSERAALLGRFAEGLAHEIRNPLNSISLQLAIADRRISRLGEEIGEELRGLLGIVRHELRRLDALVGDFLLFSRARGLDLTSGSLAGVANDAVDALSAAAAEAGVRLVRRELPEATPLMRLDRDQLKQAVLNLVRNAIDASPGGEVVVSTGVVRGRATLSVQDSGPGLPAGVDVFQPFLTTKAHGTGLGLPIAQQIVADHGGEIAATNAAGSGALFTISFPL